MLAITCIAEGQTAVFDYPVNQNLYIPGSYDGRSFYYDREHLGEDIMLAEGTPIKAIADGRVVQYEFHNGYATTDDGTSIAVAIEHDLGRTITLNLVVGHRKTVSFSKLCSVYGHIRKSAAYSSGSRLGWRVGDLVKKGDVIGYVNDDPHNGDGRVHLHLGIRIGGHLGRWTYYGYESTSILDSLVANFAAASEVIPALGSSVSVTDFFQKNQNGQYTITCPSDNLVDAQFKLTNPGSTAVTFNQVAMALHLESDDSYVADVAVQSNVTVPAGGTYQFPRSFLDGTNPNLQPRTYRLVAKVQSSNGVWTELSPHLPFTIVSRSSSTCSGGATDSVRPTISSFIVSPETVALGSSFTIQSVVSDTGGSGLSRIELWRAPDANGIPGIWSPITSNTLSGNGPTTSSFLHSPSNPGVYWFGVHLFDGAGNQTNEPSPLRRSVTTSGTVDTDITNLGNSTRSVPWFYIENGGRWFIVSADSNPQVLHLAGADRSVSGVIKWRPVSNSGAYAGYPAAPSNFTSVTVSTDGRRVSFGAALGTEPDVLQLANSTQTVKWFYVQSAQWYIVDAQSGNPSVLKLQDADSNYPGVIVWKPIHNFSQAVGQFPAAGIRYGFVTVAPNGRTVQFGAVQ